MGGGPESRCVGRVSGLQGAVHLANRTHDLRRGSQDQHPYTIWENHKLQLNI